VRAVVALVTALGWAGCAQIFDIDPPQPVPPPGDGGAPDGCAALLARAFRAPIVPPNMWAGIDLSGGGQFTDVPGSGGATLAQVGLRGCAAWAEPTQLAQGAEPMLPGYRQALLGVSGDAGPESPATLTVQSNMESGALYWLGVGQGYTGTIAFHSRRAGAYGDHTYEIGIGRLERDGTDFPPAWGDGGVEDLPDGGFRLTASAWVNEVYDGLMATFSPATPPLTTDCASTIFYGYLDHVLKSHWDSCLAISAPAVPASPILGVRPLALYFVFSGATNQVTQIYTYWWGGVATPTGTFIANTEILDYAGVDVSPAEGFDETGGLHQAEYASNPLGLTWTEAVEIEGSGQPALAPDPGYGAIAWGQSGEVMMEYDLDSGVNYRVFARAGYPGLISAGFTGRIGGPLQLVPGTDYVIDWSDGGVSGSVTPLSNAVCLATDTDCVASGDCTIVPDDGRGNSYLGFPCGTSVDLFGITFPQGKSAPSQTFTTNLNLVP
jgi:hypothetical protein